MTTLPTAVVVTQWVLLVALGALMVVLYRQMAYLIDLGTNLHEKTGGIDEGEVMPRFSYRPLKGRGHGRDVQFETYGRPTLVMLTDPRCSSCEKTLIEAERETREHRADGLRVVALTDAPRALVSAVGTYQTTQLDVGVVDDGVIGGVLKTNVNPYFYGVRPDGVVAVRGTATDGSQVRKLVDGLLERSRSDADGIARGDSGEPAFSVTIEGVRKGDG